MDYLVQLGMYTPLTDGWALTLDLNDGQNLEVVTFDLGPAALETVFAQNARMPGGRAVGQVYAERDALLTLQAGPAASEATLAAALTSLVQAQEAARLFRSGAFAGLGGFPRPALKLQPPGAPAPMYADVLALALDFPTAGDTPSWIRLWHAGLAVEVVLAPYLRGPRQTFQNLVSNPGFEQPANQPVTLFDDPMANSDAYTLLAGSLPNVAGNVAALLAGSSVALPAAASSGPISSWQVRFQFATGLTCGFGPHGSSANASSDLNVGVSATAFNISHTVAGVAHTLASATVALTNTAWYWLVFTQFPNPGAAIPPLVTAALSNDSGGAIGALVATLGPVATYDAVTNLSGAPAISAAGATLAIGGNFAHVHRLQGFGPGAWTFASDGGHTGACAGCWDASNVYGAGPLASRWAATVCAAPAGTFQGTWSNFTGGAPGGSQAVPVVAGHVVATSVVYRSTGLSASARIQIIATEYDVNGNYLRNQEYFQDTDTGGAWRVHSESWTVGANAVWLGFALRAEDGTAGASAGAIASFENVQVWDVTTTGVAAGLMPYCELRFPQSPGMFTFAGVLGDVPAPATLALGAYPNGGSAAAGVTIAMLAGRRAVATWAGQLVGAPLVWNGDGTNVSCVLDTTCWSGYRAHYANAAGNYEPLYLSGLARDQAGTCHLWLRSKIGDTPAASQNLWPYSYLVQNPWLGNGTKEDRLALWQGTQVYPWAAANAWYGFDAGLMPLPAGQLPTQADPTQVYVTAAAQSTTLATSLDADAALLVPVDGEVLQGQFTVPGTYPAQTGWLWMIFDGQAGADFGIVASGWSLEGYPVPNLAHSAGAPGTTASAAPGLTSTGDAAILLDPQAATVDGTGAVHQGVAQLGATCWDSGGNALPIAAQVWYSPRYLWPR